MLRFKQGCISFDLQVSSYFLDMLDCTAPPICSAVEPKVTGPSTPLTFLIILWRGIPFLGSLQATRNFHGLQAQRYELHINIIWRGWHGETNISRWNFPVGKGLKILPKPSETQFSCLYFSRCWAWIFNHPQWYPHMGHLFRKGTQL